METLLIISFAIFISFTIPALCSAQTCRPDSCNEFFGPTVRFPFRLRNRQPSRCGYPGFDLHCNSQNQTVLNLPGSGQFIVDHIDYVSQSFFISDTGSCLPSRILNFSLSGSPFGGAYTGHYTVFNCSSNWTDYTSARYMPLFCLSGSNYTVVAVSSPSAAAQMPLRCRRIARVSVPMRWSIPMYYWSPMDLREDLQLIWSEPACGDCEIQGGVCGYERGSGFEIGCSRPSRTGLPRGAKYGIIIGVGTPALLCIIGLACYGLGMVRVIHHQRRHALELPATVSDLRPAIRSAPGLDGPTIQSYPVTVLGESRRLPKPSDSICPICLSDYQPKETLRSIPECNHYFHSDCIDEWLKLNGTCPLCRSSLEGSSSSSSSTTTLSPSMLLTPSESTISVDRS